MTERNAPISPSPGAAQAPHAQPGGMAELTFYQYIDILRRRKWSLLGLFVGVMLLSSIYTLTRPKVYESSAILVVVNGAGNGGGRGESDILGNLAALTQARNVDTQVEILKSPELLNVAFGKLAPQDRIKGFHPDRPDAGIQKWCYRIENTLGTDTITITCQAFDPKIAAKLSGSIADTYLERDLTRTNGATKAARQYVEAQMVISAEKLSVASNDLAQFKKRSKILDSAVTLEQATIHMFALRDLNDTAQSALRASVKKVQSLHDRLASTQPRIDTLTTVEQNPEFAQIMMELSGLQLDRSKALQEFAPTEPAVTQIDGQIKAEKDRLAKVAKTVVSQSVKDINPVYDETLTAYSVEIANEAGAKVQAEYAAQALSEAEKESQAYPDAEKSLTQLTETVEELQKTHASLTERFYALAINEQSSLANGYVTSHATPSKDPTFPKVTQTIALSALFGLIISFAFVLTLERLDTRIHDPETVEKITGLPILAAVPETERGSENRPLIGSVTRGHAFLESFRILRNNISFSMPGRPIRLMAITSAGRAEGKSTTSINLAIALAMDGRRVLLIDGDLRRPSIHTTLGTSREIGLTSVVTGRISLESAVQATEYENLSSLASGPLPPNPTEFLNSVQAREVFERAAEAFDIVVVDSPPCSGLSDVQVISTFVDAVILVVSLEITRKPQLLGTMQTMWQANAPMMGVVLNRVDVTRAGYGYYYYYYYYSYEEGTGRQTRKSKKNRKSDSDKTARS